MQRRAFRQNTVQQSPSVRRGVSTTELATVLALIIAIIAIAALTTSNKMQLVFAKVGELQGQTPPHPSAKPTATEIPIAPSATASFLSQVHEDFYDLALVAGLMILCVVLANYAFRKPRRKPTPLSLHNDSVDETQLATLPHALFEKRQKLFRRLSCLAEAGELHDVRVKHIMSLIPSTVLPTTEVTEIAQSMQEHRFRHILVADESQNLMGIISDRDVGQREGNTAEEIMSERITVVDPDCEAISAVTTMMNRGISALPVVVERKLVGILTTTDIMLIMQCLVLMGHREEGVATSMAAESAIGNPPAAPLIDSTAGTLTGIAALLQQGHLPPRQ
jgi:CBS domain-containing protein